MVIVYTAIPVRSDAHGDILLIVSIDLVLQKTHHSVPTIALWTSLERTTVRTKLHHSANKK